MSRITTFPASLIGLIVSFSICLAPVSTSAGIWPRAVAAVVAMTLAIVAFLWVIVNLIRVRVDDRVLAVVTGLAALLAYLVRTHVPRSHPVDLAFDLALLVFAAGAGKLFAAQVQEAWWLVPLGLTGAVADLASVFVPSAPTRRMLETGSPVLDYLLMMWPNLSGGRAKGFLGVADLVVAAILYSVSARFGMDTRRSFIALVAALAGCLALAGGLGLGLPAIPFMFVVYVAAHWTDLKTSFENRKRT